MSRDKLVSIAGEIKKFLLEYLIYSFVIFSRQIKIIIVKILKEIRNENKLNESLL